MINSILALQLTSGLMTMVNQSLVGQHITSIHLLVKLHVTSIQSFAEKNKFDRFALSRLPYCGGISKRISKLLDGRSIEKSRVHTIVLNNAAIMVMVLSNVDC